MNRRLFLGQSTALALLAGLPTIGSANLKNAHTQMLCQHRVRSRMQRRIF